MESHHAGLTFEPDNEADFNAKLSQLTEPSYYAACKNGCLKLAEDFDRQMLADRMLEVIEGALKKS